MAPSPSHGTCSFHSSGLLPPFGKIILVFHLSRSRCSCCRGLWEPAHPRSSRQVTVSVEVGERGAESKLWPGSQEDQEERPSELERTLGGCRPFYVLKSSQVSTKNRKREETEGKVLAAQTDPQCPCQPGVAMCVWNPSTGGRKDPWTH